MPLDFEKIMEIVRRAMEDANLVDSASEVNFAVSKKYLSNEYITRIAKQFYVNSY